MKTIKRIFINISAFVFLIVFGALSLFLLKDKNKKEYLPVLEIGNNKFEIEIADNAILQARGLSGRESLPENQGMLFIFDGPAIQNFWMAGMKFPLDIIWIHGDKVAGFAENVPPVAGIPKIYPSPEPVDKVLEINAGLVKKLGIKIGDRVIALPLQYYSVL